MTFINIDFKDGEAKIEYTQTYKNSHLINRLDCLLDVINELEAEYQKIGDLIETENLI